LDRDREEEEEDDDVEEDESDVEIDAKNLENEADLKELRKCWQIPSICVMVRAFQEYLKMNPISPAEFEVGLLDPMSDIRLLGN
jgi:hypothetical protein